MSIYIQNNDPDRAINILDKYAISNDHLSQALTQAILSNDKSVIDKILEKKIALEEKHLIAAMATGNYDIISDFIKEQGHLKQETFVQLDLEPQFRVCLAATKSVMVEFKRPPIPCSLDAS